MKGWFHLNPRSGVPMYLQLKEQIKTAVAGGVLRPGERLPSVREMAVTLTVNPNTVARSYGDLEREGLLVAEQGRGTFVSNSEPLLRTEERQTQVRSLIDKVMIEGYNLKMTPEQLAGLWAERLKAWENRLAR